MIKSVIAIVISIVFSLPALAVGEGEICGTVAGITCDAGLWCDHRPGMCGVQDAEGICVKVAEKPENCGANIQQVCGCDGNEYPTDCHRQIAGAYKSHDGPCK